MQAPDPVVFLLRDKQGEETFSYDGVVHRTVIHNVLRGSLLTPIPVWMQATRADGKATHNCQTMYRNYTATLFCDGGDVVPLSEYEYLLLAGIQSLKYRYQTFIAPNKLEWGEGLKVGDQVLVSIPNTLTAESGATVKTSAIIQYVGPVEGRPGLTFGVEILDLLYYGGTDGMFRDERYFTCRDGNGLFESLDKLSEDPTGGSPPQPPPGGQCHTPLDGQQNGWRKPRTPPVASAGPPPQFEMGDRVVTFTKRGGSIHGTVRWAGKYGYQDEKEKYHSFPAIGVETDVPVSSTELDSCLPQRRLRFPVAKGKGQVFVREQEAMLEADYMAPAEKPSVQPQQTQETESYLEQELRQEAEQLRDQMAAQSLEQQRLVEQLLEDQQRQTQQREQLQREKQQLESENQQHIHRLEQLQWEQRQKEELSRESQDRIQQLEQLQREQQQQKEELLRESRDRIRQLEQEKQLRVQEVHHLQQQLQQEQERSRRLQERLDTSATRPATQLLSIVQFNTVNRTEVQVQTHIGEGAWGVVARGKFGGQPVAVKWPHMTLLKRYPNTVDRMRREVRIMAQVRHPNLVRFIAAVLDEAAERLQAPPMIITELLDTNLRLAYEQGRLQTTDCVTILRDVAYALHYLHEHLEPIIHRDISAPNVLLQALPNEGWLAKVSDFGSANLAKLAHTAGEGAIIYTAPEAFPSTDLEAEPPPMTTKIDVYSYGILICEVVTSRPPFTENLRGMLQEVKTKWEFMYNLIARCTKHSAEDRPTMAQVLDELNSLPRPPPRSLPRPQQ